VEENERVLAAVDAIQTNDWGQLGALLDASHASLRDLYEVSRPEMDALVAELKRSGALGARMTGGGFGGCAVALFRAGTRGRLPGTL
jgi:galactokinase